MGKFSAGEDLFATLLVVSLLVIFIVALTYSYHVYAERMKAWDDFELALNTAEELKNRVLAVAPGLIGWSAEKLGDYSELLVQQGVGLRVEIKGFEGEVLCAYGTEPNPLDGYFSRSCSVSLPVALVRDQGSAELSELIVWVSR